MLYPGAGGLQQNLKVNEQQGPMNDKGKLVATTSVFSEDKFPELQSACQNVQRSRPSLSLSDMKERGNLNFYMSWLIWNFIHCSVQSRSDGDEWHATFVYEFNSIGQIRELWISLKTLPQTSHAWLICGDFNTILYSQDRLFGQSVTNTELKDFAKCIHDLGLAELTWTGNYYTWTNKQQGSDKIYSRIDRALGNDEWMLNWGHVRTEYDLQNFSNHCPMILKVKRQTLNIQSPFRFFNIWVDHKEFIPIVERVWTKKLDNWRMKNVWRKLKSLKPLFRKLNNTEYRGLTQKIEKARIDLRNIQGQLAQHNTDQMIDLNKETLQQLEKWSLMEESILKQKSRDKWIKLGDSNTKYFSAVVKEKRQ
ncbi:hypothetical protein KY284_000605 [Solanum tuberosum]|nr:hypothetical protein KY284_000605 [Solanum tuberosum]